MTKNNPFPGMNPFMELTWHDAHIILLGYVRDDLQEQLPEGLRALAEQEAVTIGGSDDGRTFRPDIVVQEPWKSTDSGVIESVEQNGTRSDLRESECVLVLTEEETSRWIEIRDESGRLITVIELLSPTNKCTIAGRRQYREKWHTFASARVNVVEIDLIRQGECAFPVPICETLLRKGATYAVHVFRASTPGTNKLYPIRLRQRLPVIAVPLRDNDADVLLDLQPLVNRCHERGRYHMLDYDTALETPFCPEDAAWVNQLLNQAGLK